MKKVKTILFSIVCLMAACFAAVVLLNMRNDKYDKLPDADRQALLELETYMKAEQVTPVWQDFSLYDKTFVTINKSDKTVYLVNPEKEPKGIFVRRIKMPSDSGLRCAKESAIKKPSMILQKNMWEYRHPGSWDMIKELCILQIRQMYLFLQLCPMWRQGLSAGISWQTPFLTVQEQLSVS